MLSSTIPNRIFYTLVAIGFVILVFMGWQMSQLPLWRYQTLFFYGAVWSILFLFVNRKSTIRTITLLTSSVILLSIGFPPLPPLTLFIGLVPLFIYLKDFESTRRSKLFLNIYLVFLGYNVFTTYWVANTAFFAGMFAFFVNAFLMSIPFYIYFLLKPKSEFQPLLILPLWLSFEYLHYRWGLSWPWLTLGNGLSTAPSIIQWFEYTGVLGGTLWIWLVNLRIYQTWNNRSTRNISLLSAASLVPVVLSLFLFYQTKEPISDVATFTVVNPNIEPHYEDPASTNDDKLKKFITLLTPESLQTDVIVIPETFLSRINLGDPTQSREVALMQTISREQNVAFITGVSGFQLFDESVEPRPTLRVLEQGGSDQFYEVYNNSMLITPDGKIKIYNKKKFVPGAESFPFRNILGFLEPLVNSLGGTIQGFGDWPRDEIFTYNNIHAAPIICYEADYGEFCSQFAAEANVFAVPSEDGWWGNTAGHRQQWHINRLRCIEQRRSMARASNYGTSGFFDTKGRTLNRSKQYGKESVLTQQIPLSTKITFYSRYGDYIGLIGLVISGILVIFFLLKLWRVV